jgi:hypothetical protein
MSHRQKNKHKSRHRKHADNGPSVPQLGRTKPGPAKPVVTDVETTPASVATTAPTPVAVDTTVSSPAS